jgi:formylglycine-generating enzyme required for sulfatase activity
LKFLKILFGKSRICVYIIYSRQIISDKIVKILIVKVLLYAALVLASQADSLETEYEGVEVSINSDPSGAKVIFNDGEMGETPVIFYAPAGKYRIILIKDHHKAYYEAILLKGTEFSKTYKLEDLRAGITIKSFNKAKIFINEDQVKNDELIKIPAQEIRIRVEMEGSPVLEKTVVLNEKDSKLFMLYPDIPTGMVNINVKPSDACVEVWEEGVEKYISSGSKAFANLPAGHYLWRVSSRGYKSRSGEIDVTSGEVGRLNITLDKGTDIGGKYVLVEGGSFIMGGSENFDEKPGRKVRLSDFYIGKYEITQAEWDYVMGKDGFTFKGDSLPAETVSWFDAVKFCNRLSEIERLEKCYEINGERVTCNFSAKGYRLPTEAEWEYAAKGGKAGQDERFSGSEDPCEVAVHAGCGAGSTKGAGCRKPNGLDVYDLTGNVSEWCWDWYGEYPPETQKDPAGPQTGFLRVVRGGSWVSCEKYCTNEFRNLYNPRDRHSHVGFRVARTK